MMQNSFIRERALQANAEHLLLLVLVTVKLALLQHDDVKRDVMMYDGDVHHRERAHECRASLATHHTNAS